MVVQEQVLNRCSGDVVMKSCIGALVQRRSGAEVQLCSQRCRGAMGVWWCSGAGTEEV